MSESLVLKARGLSRYSDPMSARPEGSLNTASDIVIDKTGSFTPRRGFKRLLGTFTNQANGIIPYSDSLIMYTGTTNKTLSLYNETTGALSAYSGFTSTNAFIRYAEAAGNLYFTSNTGVFKLDSTSGTIVEAGAPPALGGLAYPLASSGFMADGSYAAYRVVWGLRDANDNLILGAPSNPILVYNNTGGTADMAIDIQVPSEVTTSHFVQLYRTATAATSSVGDECRLVSEDFYTTYTAFDFVPADVSTTNDYISETAHGYPTGTAVVFTTTGTPPAGLTNNTTYYVIRDGANAIKLATTLANATKSTPVPIDITSQGSGTHTITHKSSTMQIIDRADDELIASSTSLYTNSTREGISQSNDQPPKVSDIAVYNNHMFYANTTYKHSYSFQLLGTGTTSGLVTTDTITIDGLTYTANSSIALGSENFITRQFRLESSTGSPASDVRITAESLVRCINGASTNIYAYYDSSLDGLPGLIRLETRNFLTSSSDKFSVVASTTYSSPFIPDITVSKDSSAESYANRLTFSKNQEYEAVPKANYFDVGSKSEPILRIAALRDSLFIIKSDGIWRLTGTSTSNFAVDQFDTSAKLLASSSIAVLNNLIYGLFDQGVCTLSESGVSIITASSIEGDLKTIRGAVGSNLDTYAFGVSYESDRKYMLWTPRASSDTYPTICYVYNTITDSWTTYDRACKAAVVNPYNDLLYISPASQAYISKERKDYTSSDFSDEQISVTVTAVNGSTLTLSSLTGISIGDVYYETSSKFSLIDSISQANSTITCREDLEYSTSGSVTFTYSTTDTLSSTSHGFRTGLAVRLTTTNTLPTGLATGTTYYVYRVNANTMKLCATKAAAISGTAFVSITGAGTGTHTMALDSSIVTPEVRPAFTSIIEWNPIHLNSPGHLKQFSEVMFLMNKDFRGATASFKTNLSNSWTDVSFTGSSIGLWGLFSWGELAWGGETELLTQHRTYVPRDKQRASVLYLKFTVDTAYSEWDLAGVELTYRNAGGRATRT